ncbi:C40 family peptidase [Enterobacter kobei]|uniref:C40 family peptidase n=1 Tax=Enterobacter kobei TaxID=208224 RepID=UPI00235DE749|nr:NlpC/P60 family protein [Enterobacter kobei]
MPQEFMPLQRNGVYDNNFTTNTPKNNIRKKILHELRAWSETPYLLGGNSQNGIDCSALMQNIFLKAMNINLPRTTSEQIKKGAKVDISNIREGDLVFFLIEQQQFHVGTYIGNNEFIHASSSRGVVISSLANKYWVTKIISVRRIV